MRFKEIRKARKLTQQQVANLLDIPLRTYQNYERGVNDPDTDIICKLADYYGVTTDYLIGYSTIAIAGTDSFLEPDEERLLASYRSFDESQQQALLALVEAFADMHHQGSDEK